MNKVKWIMFGSLLLLGAGAAGWIADWCFPFFEWTTMLLYVNYFSVLSMCNCFYDTVHEENVQLSKGVRKNVMEQSFVSNSLAQTNDL
jgi:hypothetical protein